MSCSLSASQVNSRLSKQRCELENLAISKSVRNLQLINLAIVYCITIQSVRLSGGADAPFHVSNVGKCNKAFGHVMGSSSYRAMVIVGKMEELGK